MGGSICHFADGAINPYSEILPVNETEIQIKLENTGDHLS